jgi:DNA primase
MRPLPSEDARDQVRSRLNLVDVVQQHVRLRKEGRELKGLCPFHQEKTPSFHVNEQKQSWYCFGCEKGGDMFDFIEQIEKVDFPGALRILAEMAGVELPERSGAAMERAQLRRRLVELNRLAAQYYEYVLHTMPAGEPGRQLLERRRVDEATARRFGLGYAPGGASFASFLRRRGHSMADAVAAGLVRRGGGQDFFQQRLMVPIRDERGQPVAFTARTVLEGEPRKYVNTSETAAYVKGRVLFGLDLARPAIEEHGHAVLMEGQFDVIAAHQHGVGNAIASSGTALTPEQLALLKRFTDEVVLVFDNDRAGRSAAERAVELAQGHQVGTRIARLTGGAKDPDEFLRGGGRWEDVVAEARPGWEVLVEDAREGLNPHEPSDREAWIRRVRAVLGRISDPAQQLTYAQVAIDKFESGSRFELSPAMLLAGGPPASSRLEAPAAKSNAAAPAPQPGLASGGRGKKLTSRVDYLLRVLAVRPEAVGRVLGILDAADLDENDREAYLRVVTALERGGPDGLSRELDQFPLEEQAFVRRAWAEPPPSVTDATVDDVVRRIQRSALVRRHRVLKRALDEAERRQNRTEIAGLEVQLRELSERISGLEMKVG